VTRRVPVGFWFVSWRTSTVVVLVPSKPCGSPRCQAPALAAQADGALVIGLCGLLSCQRQPASLSYVTAGGMRAVFQAQEF
jgi:hypothetical protein